MTAEREKLKRPYAESCFSLLFPNSAFILYFPLSLPVRSGVFLDDEADLALFAIRWSHQLTDGVKDHFELRIVFPLEFLKLLCKIFTSAQHFSQSDEGSHDFDIDTNSTLTPQHTGKHRYALFGKKVYGAARREPPQLEITICDFKFPPPRYFLRSQFVTLKH
jgi:hypothetical protein